ncbi:mechanosensitive ion channel family protein [Corallococcus sp. 4LFB]|uniref:mechanosensitive ion channel family protein n=1 Tax=Corallococcus sp. 4LFB TaxID=3383249 RepID=UPI003976089F
MLAWALPALAWAQAERVTVRLDGRAVLRLGPGEGETASERAARVERRLAALAEGRAPLSPSRVEPSGERGTLRLVSVQGVPIVTITPDDAQDHVTTVDALAAQWSRAIDVALGQARQVRQSAGARFGSRVLASIRTAFGRVGEAALTLIPRLLAALLVLLVFWALAAGLRAVLRRLFRRVIDDLTVENLVKQVAYYALWGLGLLLALGALGVEWRSAATGLGLTGLALGFALKDILSNFVSGLLLLALRPFRVGDEIVVGDTEGRVERVVLRATHVRTYDGRLVLVPNAEVFTARMTNNTASPMRRASVRVFLGYGVDLPRALRVLLSAVPAVPGVLEAPAPSVQVAELGQDDLVLEVRFWTDSRRSDFVGTTAAVREALVAAAQREGIPLPDPDARLVSFRSPIRAPARGVDE